ncbi:hypothetical protein MBAV_003460 [Candidatus Magnetobacterium bavaricum]|uniref:Uncharacterized protein n=1 Tax=Candidatus Magnetobacterium bavaricum TaxID=29290 RepID=A0A0F3GUK1_9BACT|nr:hypothetical protein MBAV_003460 [Candidatus Magnetobacterium bavaricum]
MPGCWGWTGCFYTASYPPSSRQLARSTPTSPSTVTAPRTYSKTKKNASSGPYKRVPKL